MNRFIQLCLLISLVAHCVVPPYHHVFSIGTPIFGLMTALLAFSLISKSWFGVDQADRFMAACVTGGVVFCAVTLITFFYTTPGSDARHFFQSIRLIAVLSSACIWVNQFYYRQVAGATTEAQETACSRPG